MYFHVSTESRMLQLYQSATFHEIHFSIKEVRYISNNVNYLLIHKYSIIRLLK